MPWQIQIQEHDLLPRRACSGGLHATCYRHSFSPERIVQGLDVHTSEIGALETIRLVQVFLCSELHCYSTRHYNI